MTGQQEERDELLAFDDDVLVTELRDGVEVAASSSIASIVRTFDGELVVRIEWEDGHELVLAVPAAGVEVAA